PALPALPGRTAQPGTWMATLGGASRPRRRSDRDSRHVRPDQRRAPARPPLAGPDPRLDRAGRRGAGDRARPGARRPGGPTGLFRDGVVRDPVGVPHGLVRPVRGAAPAGTGLPAGDRPERTRGAAAEYLVRVRPGLDLP